MSAMTVDPSNQQIAIYNALVPKEGPKAVPVNLDFTLATSFLIDFTQAYLKQSMSVIQTLWVDNFANAQAVIFTVAGTSQTIEVPPNSQGSFPIISAIRAKITVTSTTAGIVRCIFLNVPLPAAVWYQGGSTVSVTGLVFRAGALEVLAPTTTANGGASHSIVVGGTPQTAIAAGAIFQQGLIKNPNAATESLFVDMVQAAGLVDGAGGTTIELKAGDKFIVPPLANAVSVNAVTTAHAFIVNVT